MSNIEARMPMDVHVTTIKDLSTEAAENVFTVHAGADIQTEASCYKISINGRQLPLLSVLESILFVADAPVDVAQIRQVLNIEEDMLRSSLQMLATEYAKQDRGLRLHNHDGKFQLVSRPDVSPLIETFLNLDANTKLSNSALETLAIIAYGQPITRTQIEAIRGVDCTGVLRTLLLRGLIEERGRQDGAGRPILYGVTNEFMHYFGLTQMSELPPLEKVDADTLWATAKLAETQMDEPLTADTPMG